MIGVREHRRTFGQFFTPDPVVACCYALVAGCLPSAPRIVDPACGDGAFLRYAAAHALAAPADLTGCDVDAVLVGALVDRGLAGVWCADGLEAANLPGGVFDLVVGNPPFGVTTSARGPRPLPSEARFLLRAIELARPGGYIALVLPSGVLANQRLTALRAELLAQCTLLAAIALPRATFQRAGTSAACSIVLLRKAPVPAGHLAFFALADTLADLPALERSYRAGPLADGARPADGGAGSSFWLPQTPTLAQRLDAHFWRPDFVQSLERLSARHALRPLGELLGRGGLIAGDHVRPSRGEARGAGLPYEYYQTREFLAAGYNYAGVERCDERAYRRLAYTAVRRHDILVSCAGVGGAGKGRACIVTHQPGPSCTGDVLTLRPAAIDPLFLFLFLGSRAGRSQLLRFQNGVGTSNISADELLQIQIPLVAPAIQQRLAASYTPVTAAHDRAMAAFGQGDVGEFKRARAQAEALLHDLQRRLEHYLLGDEGSRSEW